MCQLVATIIHLFKCRYECQNFGFWGLFLAGWFCVYITQMNFHFFRFSYLFFDLSYFVFIPFFYRFSYLVFILLCFVPIVSRGGVTFGSLVNVAHYHVIELPYYLRLRFEVLKTCHIICAWRFENLPRCEVVLRSKILQLLGHPSTTARRGY